MTSLAAAPDTSAVAFGDDLLHIRELAVDGSALEVARHASDPEIAVRRMLEIGGWVLLAGPHGDLLDQVDARVIRLIDALDQRADGLARLRAVADAGAAKGVAALRPLSRRLRDLRWSLAPGAASACARNPLLRQRIGGAPCA